MDGAIWEEFRNDWESLAYQSKEIMERLNKGSINKPSIFIYENMPLGENAERIVKQRIGQNFFRAAVLSSYENKCCITGISISQLLIASHIKPWECSDIRTERTNPQNGLCLNALHDKAFDKGFITIDKSYNIIVSAKLKESRIDEITKAWIVSFDGKEINLPHRFLPEEHFIEYHNDIVFQH